METQIKRKEQKFRGRNLDELKQLDVREFAKLLKARKRRTVLRNFQDHEKFVALAKEKLKKGKRFVRTHKRDLVVVPDLVGMRLQIYNGKEFVPVDLTMDMLGHKFGEFSMTRVKTKHNKDGKKKR